MAAIMAPRRTATRSKKEPQKPFESQLLAVLNTLIEHHGNVTILVTRTLGRPPYREGSPQTRRFVMCDIHELKTSVPFDHTTARCGPNNDWILSLAQTICCANNQAEFTLWVENSFLLLPSLGGAGGGRLLQPTIEFTRLV